MKKFKHKKLTLSIVSLVAVIAFIGGTLAWVLAATNQSLSSSISVTFTAVDIDGSVKAWYQRKTDNSKAYFKTENGEEAIAFNAEDAENTKYDTLIANNGDEIELSVDKEYVIIGYEFTNNGDRDFIGIQSLDVTKTNMDVTYSLDGVNFDDLDAGVFVGAHSTAEYFVKIEISNVALNSEFSGGVNWDLQKFDPVVGYTARVGSASYATFEEAYNSASSGDVVIINDDVTLAAGFAPKDNVHIIAESNTQAGQKTLSEEEMITIKPQGTMNVSGVNFIIGSSSSKAIKWDTSLANSVGQFFYIGENGNLSLRNMYFEKLDSATVNQQIAYSDFKASIEMLNCEVSKFNNTNAVVEVNEKGTFVKVNFHDNTTRVIKSAGDLDIDGCTFENNQFSGEDVGGTAILLDNRSITATIKNSIFKSNATREGNAGAVSAYSMVNLTIENSTFESNSAVNGSAGALYIYNSYSIVNLYNSQMISNTSKNDGGAIFLNRGTLNISKTTFTGNSSTEGYGGAIRVLNSNAKINISNNSVYTSNTSLCGGAIYSDAKITVFDSTFDKNTLTEGNHSGAIFCSGEMIIKNSTFTENDAVYGGAIRVLGEITIEGSTFTKNTASYGGAINVLNNLKAINSTFSEQIAGEGGAIFQQGDYTLYIEDCNFDKNELNMPVNQSKGGAINANEVIVKKSNFTNNCSTNFFGGAIGAYYVKVYDSYFEANSASYGGAICATYSLIAENTEFKSNSSRSYGGALYGKDIDLQIINCDFNENTASLNGGAIANVNDSFDINNTIKIEDCDFYKNTASGDGGALYVEMFITTCTNLTFTENSAKNGGAIFCNTLAGTTQYVMNYVKEELGIEEIYLFDGIEFTSNTATSDGGAMYLYSVADMLEFEGFDGQIRNERCYGFTTIRNSTISASQSGANGGAIMSYGHCLKTANTTIQNSIASGDGGGVCLNISNMTMNDGTIIKSNSANERGGGIRLVTNSSLVMNNGEISNNSTTKSGTLSASYGGGISASSGTIVTMNGGQIHLNKCTNSTFKLGGNLFIDGEDTSSSPTITSAVFTMNGGTISGDGSTSQADAGGGLFNLGQAVILGGRFIDNHSDYGANIVNKGSLKIKGTTISSTSTTSVIGKAIANIGTMEMGNIILSGSNMDIAIACVKSGLINPTYTYSTLTITESLGGNQFTISFAKYNETTQTISQNNEMPNNYISNGTAIISYSAGITPNTANFVSDSYNFILGANTQCLYLSAKS